MKNHIFLVILGGILILNLGFVSADFWQCFEKGDEINFCNPSIEDRECDSNSCRFCMKSYDEENDCYLPGAFNSCNEGEAVACQADDGGFDTIEQRDDEKEDKSDKDEKDDDKKSIINTNNQNSQNTPVTTGGSVTTRISADPVPEEEYYELKIKKSNVKYLGLGLLPIIEILIIAGLLWYEKRIVLSDEE